MSELLPGRDGHLLGLRATLSSRDALSRRCCCASSRTDPTLLSFSPTQWGIILTVPSLMIPGGPESDSAVPGVDPTPPSQYFIPLPMDLALHLTPCLILLVDFFFFEKPYAPPASTYGAFSLAAASGVAYGGWAEWSVPPPPPLFSRQYWPHRR
jgi:hypothetical protein